MTIESNVLITLSKHHCTSCINYNTKSYLKSSVINNIYTQELFGIKLYTEKNSNTKSNFRNNIYIESCDCFTQSVSKVNLHWHNLETHFHERTHDFLLSWRLPLTNVAVTTGSIESHLNIVYVNKYSMRRLR